MATTNNVDSREVNKFSRISEEWWNVDGKFKPLHDMNPTRLEFIHKHVGALTGKKILDVGCGGGILTEALAKENAHLTGLDMSDEALDVAKQHAADNNLTIRYIKNSIEDYAAEEKEQYDVITCLELLEHVPDPASVVKSCSVLLKPDGHLFFSTINRNVKAYLLAIVGAEYIMQMLPKGTHEYKKLIRPSELDSWARQAHLKLNSIEGISYNPFNKQFALSDDLGINYIVHYSKDTKNE